MPSPRTVPMSPTKAEKTFLARSARSDAVRLHLERWLLPRVGAKPPVEIEIPGEGATSLVYFASASGMERSVVRLLPTANDVRRTASLHRVFAEVARVPGIVAADDSEETIAALGGGVLVESFLSGTPLGALGQPGDALEELGRTYARVHDRRFDGADDAGLGRSLCYGPDVVRMRSERAVRIWKERLDGADRVRAWLDRVPEDAFRFEPRLILRHFNASDVLVAPEPDGLGLIDLQGAAFGPAALDLANAKFTLNRLFPGHWRRFRRGYRATASAALLAEVDRCFEHSRLLLNLYEGTRPNYFRRKKAVRHRQRLLAGLDRLDAINERPAPPSPR